MNTDALINKYANILQKAKVGDFTYEGILSEFLREAANKALGYIPRTPETIVYGYDTDNQRNPLDRIILITETNGTKYEMPFPSAAVSDSKALHHLLCFVDPGDDYTVSFSKKEN